MRQVLWGVILRLNKLSKKSNGPLTETDLREYMCEIVQNAALTVDERAG